MSVASWAFLGRSGSANENYRTFEGNASASRFAMRKISSSEAEPSTEIMSARLLLQVTQTPSTTKGLANHPHSASTKANTKWTQCEQLRRIRANCPEPIRKIFVANNEILNDAGRCRTASGQMTLKGSQLQVVHVESRRERTRTGTVG
jgi:hypothetical protein